MTNSTTGTVVAFRPEYRTITGSSNVGLFLAQAIYWTQNRTAQKRSGWFFKTANQWQDETGLSRCEVETARRKLIEAGLLETTRKHTEVPGARFSGGRVWYRLNIEALVIALDKVGCHEVVNTLRALAKQAVEAVKAVKKALTMTAREAATMPIKNTARQVVSMVKQAFTGRANTPPPAGRLYTPEDFQDCHPFVHYFAQYAADRDGKSVGASKLADQLRRFGYQSHYVQACFDNHLKKHRAIMEFHISCELEESGKPGCFSVFDRQTHMQEAADVVPLSG